MLLRVTKAELSVQGYLEEGRERRRGRGEVREGRRSLVINITHTPDTGKTIDQILHAWH